MSSISYSTVSEGAIVPGTGATNLGKAEDAAHVSGDTGVLLLSVRKNTAAATSDTDADYQPLITDTNGRLHTVASAGTAGDVAHDGVDSGNPLKVGGKAYAPDSGPADVASLDRADCFVDLKGRMVTYLATKLDSTNDTVSTCKTSPTRAAFRAAITGLAPASSATDIFTITGSASKTVRITRLSISGVATAAGAYAVLLIKRSAADTSGTSSAPTVVPMDSSDAAGTATVLAYTANPSVGAAVGNVGAARVLVTTAAAPAVPTGFTWRFGGDQAHELVLRGIAQVLAVSLNAVTMSGGLLEIEVEWTENTDS